MQTGSYNTDVKKLTITTQTNVLSIRRWQSLHDLACWRSSIFLKQVQELTQISHIFHICEKASNYQVSE